MHGMTLQFSSGDVRSSYQHPFIPQWALEEGLRRYYSVDKPWKTPHRREQGPIINVWANGSRRTDTPIIELMARGITALLFVERFAPAATDAAAGSCRRRWSSAASRMKTATVTECAALFNGDVAILSAVKHSALAGVVLSRVAQQPPDDLRIIIVAHEARRPLYSAVFFFLNLLFSLNFIGRLSRRIPRRTETKI
jgi:hypothetical protein